MNLVFGLLVVLASANLSLAAVKGGRLLSKGGGIGAVHHAAVVQDPISGSPVVVTNVKGGGGIKGAGLGAGSAQYALSDGPFGRRVYRVGASSYPYGLLGSDYYSYPASLYTTPRRVLGRKGLVSNNLSGLSPIGLSSGLKGGIIADPALSQFSIGDAQSNIFGGRNLYRTGASSVPYGLMGLDYYSYPRQLLTQRRLSDGFGIGQLPIGLSSGLKGGIIADPALSQFSIGDSQIKTSIFGGGRNLYRTGASSVPYGLMGLDYYSYPRQLLTQRRLSDGFGIGQSPILGGGSLFTAGDSQIIGGLDSAIGQSPILGGGSLFTAGDSQIAGGLGSAIGQEKVTVVETDPLSGGQRVTTTVRRPSGGLKGGNIILSGGQGIGGLRRVKTRPVIQALQAPVVVAQSPISQVKTAGGLFGRSIFGNRAPQLIYVDGGRRFPGIDIIGGSRIGDPRLGYTQLPISTRRFANLGGLSQASIGAGATLLSPLASYGKSAPIAKTIGGPLGLAAVGHSPSKTITQEEVIGPAGDSQIITTVTKSDPIGPSKIGGLSSGGPLGLSAVGRGATVVQQEEVVNPITGQVSHVTTTQEIGQNPIDAALSQSALGDPFGQAQVSVDPFTGNVVQQNIADAVVQESISSGIGGGYNLGGYLPRISLLSQFPYDMPDNQLVRSVISSPVFQQQQELEQILVK